MGRYIVNRLWTGCVTLVLVSFLVFGLLNLLPGDVIATLTDGQLYTKADAAMLRHELGLDKPLVTRYALWVWDAGHGDLGKSLVSGRPVLGILKAALPVSLELAILALLLALATGIPLGVYSAVRQNRAGDYLARLVAILGYSIPHFYLATLVIVLPALWWGWVPPPFFVQFKDDPVGNLAFMIIPAAVLATGVAARFARLTRSAVLETLHEDYVRTARAKGIAGVALIWRHVLRNALLPVLTIVGGSITGLIAGAVVIETIFSIPGIGRVMITAIGQRDYPVISGVNIVIATLVVSVNLIVDLSYRLCDPRIAY